MIELILASVSLLLSGFSFITVYRFYKTTKPLVHRAMSIVGTKGREVRTMNENMVKVEGALSEFALEQITQKYPEIEILMGWLEQKYPDVADIIEQNPDIVMALAQKYLPLIQQYLGKRATSTSYAIE